MPTRSRDHGYYEPPDEMNRPSERMFGGLVGPAGSTRRVPIAVDA